MITIPSQKKWTQTNTGEVFGVLYDSKNMNFEKEGYATLALRSSALIYGVTNFGNVKSISYLNATVGGYFVMTSNRPFRMSDLGDTALTDMNDGTNHTGGVNFDGLVWQKAWVVSQSATFAYYTGATINDWHNGYGSDLVSGNPHPMCVHQGLNYLAIGDGNTVKMYSSLTSASANNTLTLDSSYEVRWIRYNANNLYIGTRNKYGGNAALFVWDGTGTAHQGMYPIDGNWIFSGCNYDSSIAILTSRGQLMRFNGGGFDQLAALPVYYTPYVWYDSSSGYSQGKCEQRGMIANGKRIYLNIDGGIAENNAYLPSMKSGLWEYDPSVGLYHKAGFSNDKVYKITASSCDTATDIFTTATTITSATGTLINCYSAVAGGLTQGRNYFLIKKTSTTFQLATSYDNAIAGTAIDITSFTSAGFYLHDDVHFGESDDNFTSVQIGALSLVNDATGGSSYNRMTASTVLFGAGVIENDTGSATTYTLQSLTEGYNRGYITTQKIFSTQVKDMWQKIFTKFGNMNEGNEKIVVKARMQDKKMYPIFSDSYGTWTDTTSFSTTADLSLVSTGEEVELVSGRGAGCLAHIQAIQASDGGYIVTLDEAIPGVSTGDKSVFVIQNFKKLGTADYSTIDQYLETPNGNSSKWVQFRVELRGVSEPFLEELQVVNSAFRESA